MALSWLADRSKAQRELESIPISFLAILLRIIPAMTYNTPSAPVNPGQTPVISQPTSPGAITITPRYVPRVSKYHRHPSMLDLERSTVSFSKRCYCSCLMADPAMRSKSNPSRSATEIPEPDAVCDRSLDNVTLPGFIVRGWYRVVFTSRLTIS